MQDKLQDTNKKAYKLVKLHPTKKKISALFITDSKKSKKYLVPTVRNWARI